MVGGGGVVVELGFALYACLESPYNGSVFVGRVTIWELDRRSMLCKRRNLSEEFAVLKTSSLRPRRTQVSCR